MRIAVVGGGVIGASAAKYLARAGEDVTLFAPREPMDARTHNGVFSSHYDAGRITRRLDRDPVWADLAAESIAQYQQIETESGIRFYHETGCLITAAQPGQFLDAVARVRTQSVPDALPLDEAAIAARFPYLALPDGHGGFLETKDAGYVNPRAFVAAQTSCFQNAGGKVIDDMVSNLDALEEFDRILIAAGAFTNMLARPRLDLTVFARTISVFELTPDWIAKLSDMPSLIYRADDDSDPYLVPPARYPDGAICLKIGGEPVDRRVEGHKALKDWFKNGGSPDIGAFHRERLHQLFPGIEYSSWRIAPCAVTYTPSGYPAVGPLDDRVTVATGGCGAAGKSGDRIGWHAAEAVLGRVDPRFPVVTR